MRRYVKRHGWYLQAKSFAGSMLSLSFLLFFVVFSHFFFATCFVVGLTYDAVYWRKSRFWQAKTAAQVFEKKTNHVSLQYCVRFYGHEI